MKNMVCKTLLTVSAAVGILSLVAACDKPFELDYPLNVSQNELTLKKDGGSTHVFVYSTGLWTAHFTEPVNWASLNRTQGYGNTDFIFDYSPNYGIAREVKIALAMGGHRDTIKMIQSGSVTNVSFIPDYKNAILVRQAATASISYSSNVTYGLDVMKATVQYEDEYAEPWIDSVWVEKGHVCFNVGENPEDLSRKAWITLTLPDCTGAASYLMTSRITVSQTKENPALALQQTNLAIGAAKQTVTVPTTKNNVWPYALSLKTEVSASTEQNDWLSGVKLTQDGLVFSVSENQSGNSRTAEIGISFETADGKKASASCSISQSSEQ